MLDGMNYIDPRPSPPTNLYISGYPGGMPRINWTASTSPDVDYYELWWCEMDGPQFWWSLLVTTSNTYWIDYRVTIAGYGQGEDTYRYKVRAVDQDGDKSCFSNEDEVDVNECPPWLCKELAGEPEAIPEAYTLRENYPNPFNAATIILYDLPEESFVELRIYDIMGREIRTLVNGKEAAGYKSIQWDGKDSFGNPVSSGMYIYHISSRSLESDLRFSQTRKMILLR
jgi:hypothetical protein